MSERVVFRGRGTRCPVPFVELGQIEEGVWGVVDDRHWLASPGGDDDGLELLFLTPVDYRHAVRGLSPDDVAQVVSRLRKTFAAHLPSLALGLIELRLRECVALLGGSDDDTRVRGDLLTALASFTTVPRFSDTGAPTLLDYLREGDARIIAELESLSLRTAGDLDPGGSERATRRRFATDVGKLAAGRGRPEKASVLPYVDVERAYLLTPASAELEAAAHSFHEPTMHFRDGLIMGIAERNVPALEAAGHRATVVFPAGAQLMGAAAGMTPAQLQVEVSERLDSPGFVPYLRALRLQQATLRLTARMIGGHDAELVALLSGHLQEEMAKLGVWLAIGVAIPPPDAAAAALDDVIEAAVFLVTLCRRRGVLAETGGLEALTRALSHVASQGGS